MLPDLAKIVRTSGLEVVELSGWQTRTRPPETGGFAPKGICCHHTGGDSDGPSYAEWMALTGRPDLPAPLCQLALSRSGTVYICAAGRANHAGECRARGRWLKAGDGNAQLLGIEAMNNGEEGWGPAQYQAYVRLAAALCRGYGWPASHVVAHRETSTTGKWDPGRMDMDVFRRDVARQLTRKSAIAPPTEEDPMPSAEEIAKAVWDREVGRGDNRESAAGHLLWASNAARDNRRLMRSLSGLADEIAAAVASEANELKGVDPAQLRHIVFGQASRAINVRLGSLND